MTTQDREELFSFLQGSWSVTIRYHAIESLKLGAALHEQSFSCLGPRCDGTANYRLRDCVLVGEYSVSTTNSDALEIPLDWRIQLQTDPTQHAPSGVFSTNELYPKANGVWRPSWLQFVLTNDASCVLWKALSACFPGIPVTCTVSLVVRKMTPVSWLLDTCFLFPPAPYSDTCHIHGQLCFRSECWHTRCGSGTAAPALPYHATNVLRDAVTRARELVTELDNVQDDFEVISTLLNEAKDSLERKTTELNQLVATARESELDTDEQENGLAKALLREHRRAASVEIADSVENGDAIQAAVSALEESEREAMDIATTVDDISSEAQTTIDDVLAAIWTTLGYARAQKLLENANVAVPADLSFLGSVKHCADRLSKDAQKTLNAAAILYHLATHHRILGELDHVAIIATMAKTCERIFADAFQDRLTAVRSHLVVQALFNEFEKWTFENLPDTPAVKRGFLREVLNDTKQDPIRWTGRKCAVAILLFGGMVRARKGSQCETLNPLGIPMNQDVLQLPSRLIDFQVTRNPFIHHDLTTLADVHRDWECFSECVRGLLTAFYNP